MIAPTGTIGLVMDCDTTGIEPDFALVKFKKLAGGGYFKIINQRGAGGAAHARLLARPQIAEIVAYAVGHGTLGQAPGINHATLKAKGFTDEKIAKIEAALPTAFDIRFVFNKWTLGEEFCTRHARHRRRAARRLRPSTCCATSASPRPRSRPPTIHVCGAMTLEGAPHLKAEHYRCSTAPTPAARPASATSRSKATSA